MIIYQSNFLVAGQHAATYGPPMRKALSTLLWLLVVLAVPVSTGLDAACRLAHAQTKLTAAEHASHHHNDAQDETPADHPAGGMVCCHMAGANAAAIPMRADPLASVPSGERAVFPRVMVTMSGHDPTPPRDPPRA